MKVKCTLRFNDLKYERIKPACVCYALWCAGVGHGNGKTQSKKKEKKNNW